MTITSTLFLFLFFPLTLLGYYLVRRELKNVFLLLASILFYFLSDPNSIWIIVVSIAVNYLLGLGIGHNVKSANNQSDEQFAILVSEFDRETNELKSKITELDKKLGISDDRSQNAAKKFAALCKKHAGLSELTYENLHELIDRILVHEFDEENIHKIEIYYPYLGRIPNAGKPVEVYDTAPRLKSVVRVIVG